MRRVLGFRRDRGGAGAVEFALVAPVFLAILLGIVAYGSMTALGHGLQQLAGEAARASLAGITDAERAAIAQAYVSTNLGRYGVLERARLQVTAIGSAAPENTFEVALTYDLRDLSAARLAPWLPAVGTEMRRAAVVQRGGY